MDRVKKKVLLAELLFQAFLLYLGWRLQIRSLYFAVQISEIVLLTAVLKSMPLLELSVNDLAAMTAFMLLNQVVLLYFRLCTPALVFVIPFLILLLPELLVLVKGLRRRKRGYGIAVGYAVLCCWGVLGVYRKWERCFLDYYLAREGEFVFAVKAVYLSACILVAAIFVLLPVRWLGAFMRRRLVRLQEYSMTYTEIDRSVIMVLILTLIALSMRDLVGILAAILPENNEVHLIPFWPAYSTYDIPLLWIGFFIMMVLIQVIYIRLLVKSISMKEEMRAQEKDLHQLAEYNRELENNMEDMRGIRHDMKNMFLTMGGFVERSNDEEMKVFYEENIVPYARQELQKNDLYVKLACIRSESLKSFLYFKIMQGIEQNVSVELQIQFADTGNIFCIEQIDLIRILGILIDNAAEEAKSCEGTVVISLKENEREFLLSVSNTVRRKTMEKGVMAGTTDKGPGRGNGLLIADKLIRKYRNVLLNSYFREDKFVQCLRIGK